MSKNYVTKLKNLFLSSVDLCRIGANQKARICLTKNLCEEENDELMILRNIVSTVSKAFGIEESEKNISKITNIISKALIGGEEEKIKISMSESLKSIISDANIDTEKKFEMIEKSVSDFFSTAVNFAKENQNTDNNGVFKKSKGDDSDMIDVSKMTQEDKDNYENLIKKYASDYTNGKGTKDSTSKEVQKMAGTIEMHPEVKKALDDVQKKMAELDEMKKSYEIKEMESVAKKYEFIGQKPEELADKLYKYKKSGGTIYNDYIALLDEQLAMTKSLGIFDEIGSNRGGDTVEKHLEQKIQEIMKTDANITYEQAFVKACDENDELRKAFV